MIFLTLSEIFVLTGAALLKTRNQAPSWPNLMDPAVCLQKLTPQTWGSSAVSLATLELLSETGQGFVGSPEDKWSCAHPVLALFPAFLAQNSETLFLLPSGVSPGLVLSQ